MSGEDIDENLKNKGQTEVKHKILRLYLRPWISKISKVDSKLLYVDGFAGSGVYKDGTTGSPLIAMDMADNVLSNPNIDDRITEFKCIFVENDPGHYARLKQTVGERESNVDDRIKAECIPEDFEDWAKEFVSGYEHRRPPPSLFFIDPFGYSSIPFELLTELFELRKDNLEMLVTLMSGKMALWEKEGAISSTLGMEEREWRSFLRDEMSKDQKAEVLADLYQEQWENRSDANFTLPFEMFEEGKKQTCYYLIHLSKNWQGLKVMKETMYNAGADEKYAYLGPDHTGYEDDQISFTRFSENDEFEQKIESFASELHERYAGERIKFEDLLLETLDNNVFITKHYRKAFEILSNQGKLKINGKSYTRGNNIKCDNKSELYFETKSRLTDF